ncbi:hypothetical protein P8452_48453 [Trifolium repens]|nr:hypothetical protein P8452_48453 [Trifolium repens]
MVLIWRSVRKFITLNLLSASKVEMFGLIRKQQLDVLVKSLEKSAFVGNIVYKMILGRSKQEQFDLKKYVQEGSLLIGAFNLADYVPWLGVFNLQVCLCY